jgi:hypothetical protein
VIELTFHAILRCVVCSYAIQPVHENLDGWEESSQLNVKRKEKIDFKDCQRLHKITGKAFPQHFCYIPLLFEAMTVKSQHLADQRQLLVQIERALLRTRVVIQTQAELITSKQPDFIGCKQSPFNYSKLQNRKQHAKNTIKPRVERTSSSQKNQETKELKPEIERKAS